MDDNWADWSNFRHTISPTNTATNPISVDQPYAGPAASCCSINGTHSTEVTNINFILISYQYHGPKSDILSCKYHFQKSDM
jgi:hypothetical protein